MTTIEDPAARLDALVQTIAPSLRHATYLAREHDSESEDAAIIDRAMHLSNLLDLIPDLCPSYLHVLVRVALELHGMSPLHQHQHGEERPKKAAPGLRLVT